jgi:hypothetical protein
MKYKDDPDEILTLGLNNKDDEPMTEKDWDRRLKQTIAENQFKIRFAKPRALIGLAGLAVGFLGMILVSPGMPLRPLAFILGPLVVLLVFVSMMMAAIFGTPLLIYWLLNREK